MEINVKLFATLQDYLPPGAGSHILKVSLTPGTTVRGLLDKLKIPEETTIMLYVNGKPAAKDTVLKPGDALSAFPPLGGG